MRTGNLLFLTAALSGGAMAQTAVWNTNSSSWNTGTNWDLGTPPNSTSSVASFVRDFTATPTITLDNTGGFIINRLNFDDTGSSSDVSMTINAGTGGSITFGGTTPTADIRATTVTINPAVTLGTGFNKIGAGNLVLNGAVTGWTPAMLNAVTAGTLTFGTGSGQSFTWAGVAKSTGAGTVQYNAVSAGEFTLPASYSVGAGGITLNASGTFDGTSGFTKTGAGTLTLSNASTNVAGTYDVTGTLGFNGLIAGSSGFTKEGSGTLILGNAGNTITGAVAINAGTLQISTGGTNSPAYGSAGAISGSSITLKTGTVLDLPRLHASTATTTTWALPTVTLEGGSTLRFRHSTGSNTNNLAANIATSGTTTIDSNGGSYAHDINLSGILSGSGTINYLATSSSGSGTYTRTLTLNNTSTSFSGDWFVDYTASTSDDYASLKSAAAGALGTGSVTLDDRARLINGAANGINSLSGVTLQKATSALDLLGSNAWTNPSATLTAANGTINIGSAASSIGNFALNSSGTVTLNADPGGSLAAGTYTFTQGTLSGSGSLTGSGTATKTGAGTVFLANSNSFSGGTVIDNGILQANANSALGTGKVTIGQTDISATSHSLRLNGVTIANDIDAKFMYTTDYLGTITALGGSVSTVNGDVTVFPSLSGAPSRGGHLASTGAGSVLRLMGVLNVGGAQTVITQRDGTVEYGGGATTSYTLQVTNTARLAADNGLGPEVLVQLGVSGNSTLDLNGFSTVLDGVTRSSNTTTVTNTAGTPSVLTVGAAANREYSGTIEDGNGGVSLVKQGSSTLALSGNNTYSGATTVSAGTLLVSGSLGATAVTVGADGTIGGDGAIGGSLYFEPGADFLFDPLTTLTVNGASVGFGGFGIADLAGFSAAVADGTYTLIDGTALFDFTNVSNIGVAYAHDLGGGRKAYFEEGSLKLVVIPEPAAALLGGIGCLMLLRRRRS